MDLAWTQQPDRRSFLPVAETSHFSLQNLPFGVFRTSNGQPRCGSRLGDDVIDLAALYNQRLLPPTESGVNVFEAAALNQFASCGKSYRQQIRIALSQLFDAECPSDQQRTLRDALIPIDQVQMQLPMEIGDYTDFYSSREHATNVGTMFRGKDNALNPNWLHLPVAYHGRASSVVVSGTPIRRPNGQKAPTGEDTPGFGPSKAMDFELEMGFFLSEGNALGTPIPIASAEDHLFGLVLVNDWSARDIQRWEYVPLGPFLAKNFATSISPWVVTLEALEPFRCEGPTQDPEPLPYLRTRGGHTFDIQLEVLLATPGTDAQRIALSNFRFLYWSMAQQLAHHSITGCNMRIGDLLASGTISGPTADSYGSLLELAWKGEKPLELSSGEVRSMLLDGDTLTLSGWAQGEGYRVGFGDVTGTIQPAFEFDAV